MQSLLPIAAVSIYALIALPAWLPFCFCLAFSVSVVIGISSTAPRSKGPIVLVVGSQARPFQEESSSLRAIWLCVGGGEIYVPVNARMKRSEELFYTSASCQITPMVASNYQGPFLRLMLMSMSSLILSLRSI